MMRLFLSLVALAASAVAWFVVIEVVRRTI
jgi:hypothetical protein